MPCMLDEDEGVAIGCSSMFSPLSDAHGVYFIGCMNKSGEREALNVHRQDRVRKEVLERFMHANQSQEPVHAASMKSLQGCHPAGSNIHGNRG
jgi:hypothetical protein